MKLIFIGSGSAFTVGDNNYQSNMLLETDDARERLLVDCGSDARLALYDLGLSYQHIQHVYISHLHADHVGGLEWLAFSTYFDKSCTKKPTLYTSHHLVKDLWDKVLSGGLESLEEFKSDLSTFFNVAPVDEEKGFEFGGSKIKLVRTYHLVSSHTLCPSYGLMVAVNGKKVLITTDTQFKPELLMNYYKQADIIFHDCETTRVPSGVHTHFSQLMTLDPSIKKKTWLYHYNPGPKPDAKKEGFLGFVERGQSFSF